MPARGSAGNVQKGNEAENSLHFPRAAKHSTRHFTEGALHCNTVWDDMVAPRLKNTFQPSLGSQSLPPRTCPCQSRQLISQAQLLHRPVKLRSALPARCAAGTLQCHSDDAPSRTTAGIVKSGLSGYWAGSPLGGDYGNQDRRRGEDRG